MTPKSLPEEAYAVALAMTPDVGPAILRDLLRQNDPSRAWALAVKGSGRSEADVRRAWEEHVMLGITVLLREHPSYPSRLLDDPQAPAVLFCKGDPAALSHAPTAALLGTRAPTP